MAKEDLGSVCASGLSLWVGLESRMRDLVNALPLQADQVLL
jgi:hypothetical protein